MVRVRRTPGGPVERVRPRGARAPGLEARQTNGGGVMADPPRIPRRRRSPRNPSGLVGVGGHVLVYSGGLSRSVPPGVCVRRWGGCQMTHRGTSVPFFFTGIAIVPASPQKSPADNCLLPGAAAPLPTSPGRRTGSRVEFSSEVPVLFQPSETASPPIPVMIRTSYQRRS